MSGHNIPFEFYQSPLSQPMVTETSDITIDRMGCVIPVNTTAAAVTATLAAPIKAGIIGTVVLAVDGGGYDLTLTVTGGYNLDAVTDIAFDDAQDFVTFMSIESDGTFYWRVLGQEGTDAAIAAGETLAVDTLTVDTLATITSANIATANIPIRTSTVEAAEHGAGAIGTSSFGAPQTTRYFVNGVIITEIKIDITGLGCKGDLQGDAIGLVAGGAAYIGRYVTASYGIVYRIEMSCLELPAGSATSVLDIDLMAENDGDVVYDGPVDDTVLARAGVWAAGETIVDDAPALTANDYFYLGEGDTTGDTGVYTAGQFLIRMYGGVFI